MEREMVTGFVLIRVGAGQERVVFQGLSDMSEVKGIQMVFGHYDIIAKLESNDLNELSEIVLERIRNIEGVSTTTTLIASESEEESL
ncbi:MAG: Lrp/AsnC ligand binding domain-containing protein [Thermoplasmata archaeon]